MTKVKKTNKPAFVQKDNKIIKSFSEQDKIFIIKKHLNDGIPVRKLAKEHNASKSSIYEWIDKYAHNESLSNSPGALPFINAVKDDLKLPIYTFSCLQLDGEAKQIGVYKDKNILEALKDSNIGIVKSPGSLTHVLQPLDCGNMFKCLKTNARNIKDKWAMDLYADKVKNVENILKSYNTERINFFRVINGKKSKLKVMQNGHIKMAAIGITKIHRALQKSANITTIEKSFAKAGIYPFSPTQILSLCKTKPLTNVNNYIINNLNAFGDQIDKYGELKDDYMNKCTTIPVTTNKDHYVVDRRRAVILTHPDYIKRSSNEVIMDEVEE
jgi:transposase-like protein